MFEEPGTPFKALDRLHGAERLERLKQVVLDPKLSPHDGFDFAYLVRGDYESLRRLEQGDHHCGTVGCLLGNLPAAFPAHWKFDGAMVNPANESVKDAFEDFLAITELEFEAAFHPGPHDDEDLLELLGNATAEQACANLDILIARMRAEAVSP